MFVNYIEGRRGRTVKIHKKNVQLFKCSRAMLMNFDLVSLLVILNRHVSNRKPKYFQKT